MAPPFTGPLLWQVRKLAGQGSDSGVGDAELLTRFVQRRDEAAFELLVWRHQRMVLGVCRRVLGNAHDAEDAFQAVFFALARKAASVSRGAAVAAWLHTVAVRVALRVRALAARHAKIDADVSGVAVTADTPDAAIRHDLAAVLDEEVSRLPEAYRVAVVLCYLEGRTYREAARQLRLPVGTMSARLARARTLLQRRLLRRGVEGAAALAALALCEQATATAARGQVKAAVAAAMATAAGHPAGAISGAVAALADEAMRSVSESGPKIVARLLLAGLLATGAGLYLAGRFLPAAPSGEGPISPAPEVERRARPDRVDEFGDSLPAGASRRLGTLRFRHGGGAIHNLLLTADERTLVSNTERGDRTVRAWDRATGRLLREFPGSYDDRNVAVSPDGKVLAIPADAGVVLWDLASGKEVGRLARPGVTGVAFSPDGKTVAADGANDDIYLWDRATGHKTAQLPWKRGTTTSAALLAFTPDGKTLAVGEEHNSYVDLWDVATGTKRLQLGSKPNGLHCLALSPDGSLLATGSHADGIPVWDTRTGQLTREFPLESGQFCYQVAFSPDGKTLVGGVSSVAKFRVFLTFRDLATGKETHRLDGAVAPTMAFSRDGKTLMVGLGSAVQMFDPASGKESGPTAGSPANVGFAAATPDGRTVAYRHEKDVRFQDVLSGRACGAFAVLPAGILSSAFSPDGRLLAAGVGEYAVELRATRSGELVRRLEWDKRECPGSYYAFSVAFSPDGRQLASADARAGERTYLRIWDVASGQPVRRMALNELCDAAVAFSPDGALLAAAGRTGDEGGKVRVWEAATGKELTGRAAAMNVPARGDKPLSLDYYERKVVLPRVAFSPDGKMLVRSGRRKAIPVWEAATGRERLLLEGHEESTIDVAFAPDGRTLASASWDSTIRLWDADSGHELRRLTGHRGPVRSLAFAADGRVLVSTGDDTTVLFWDVADVTRRPRPACDPITPRAWEELWEDLAHADAARAYAAMVRMAGDGPTTVAALQKRVRPARSADAETIARLLKELEDDQFPVRDKAATELAELAEAAQPALERALAGAKSPELRRRLEGLLAPLAEISGERLRQLRAIEVLDRTGTPEARQVLTKLAAGTPAAMTTAAARAALKRRER